MRPNLRAVAAILVLTAARVLVAASATASAGAQTTTRPGTADGGSQHCATAEYRQFDFFIGDWDTYDVTDSTKIIARNRVTPMLGGCAVREVYTQRDGLNGESFSAYDVSRHVWHQSWVTNHGSLLLMDGGLRNGHMVFTATVKAPNGTSSLQRVAWTAQHGSVRETDESSADGGKTWTPVFDIIFRPHK